jgi:hypothetical protein
LSNPKTIVLHANIEGMHYLQESMPKIDSSLIRPKHATPPSASTQRNRIAEKDRPETESRNAVTTGETAECYLHGTDAGRPDEGEMTPNR